MLVSQIYNASISHVRISEGERTVSECFGVLSCSPSSEDNEL